MPDAEVIRIDSRSKASEHSSAEPRMRCSATTSSGRPCRNFATDDSSYCRIHETQALERSPHGSTPSIGNVTQSDLEDEQDPVQKIREFIRRRFAGEYELDDFGYDRELSREVLLPLVKPLYESYFRVKTLG
ncbi:MAG: hypothetical protein M3198_18025, partial [Actinomycetota bacterium]|nr:hypothetical protein [Actinomycetota bacterium]